MPRKPCFQHRKADERRKRLEKQSSSNSSDFAAIVLPLGWTYHRTDDKHTYCKLSQTPGNSTTPMSVSHTLCVHSDRTWTLHVYNNEVRSSGCDALSKYPVLLTPKVLTTILMTVDHLPICAGHPDCHFTEMMHAKKNKILSSNDEIVAYLDSSPVTLNGKTYCETVRSSKCQIIGNFSKCNSCKKYRDNLRAIFNRWSKKSSTVSPSSHANERYLNTPQKASKISRLRNKVRSTKEQVKKLQEKVQIMNEKYGETIDEELHSDLFSVMKGKQEQINRAYPEGSFARLFWEEQFKAASVGDARQRRWHPTMIKWCLNLLLMSPAAYRAMRYSGFVQLPSERTLRDYTNYFEMKTGFQDEVDEQLSREVYALNLPEHRKYFGILLDEMKIKEGLVYNKYSGKIIGFTQLGNINDDLLRLEQEEEHPGLAQYVLVVMVRGTLCKLEFPYAHFGTRGITADLLFPIVDEALSRLESQGVKVISITADGASPNRKYFNLFKTAGSTVSYKTPNPYSSDGKRSLYFFVDPPHLIKTVRNCWSKSGSTGTRHMVVNGQFIEWKQLWTIYDKVYGMAAASHGVSLLPKLKLEHLKLTSFSRMRVDLAAQVLSQSVANTLAYFNEPTTTETQKFVSIFDKFFDCMNSRSTTEGIKKNKPNLKPYRSGQDERLKWLESDFLEYLRKWECSVKEKSDLEAKEQNKLMLSRETREGLKITAKAFVEMVRFLFSDVADGEMYFLSERISQDPLENYFGKQRARGGRNENPNLHQCVHNAAALRVQKSFALDPVHGNCRRKRLRYADADTSTNTPLPKRKRTTK